MQYRNHLFQVSAIVILALLITSSLAGALPGDTPPEGNVDATFYSVTVPNNAFGDTLNVVTDEISALASQFNVRSFDDGSGAGYYYIRMNDDTDLHLGYGGPEGVGQLKFNEGEDLQLYSNALNGRISTFSMSGTTAKINSEYGSDEIQFALDNDSVMIGDGTASTDINLQFNNTGEIFNPNGTEVTVEDNLFLNDNALIFTDPENGDARVELNASDTTYPDEGIAVRTLTNPPSGEPIFRVISSGGSERLSVEHDGALKTSNYLEVDGTGDSYIVGDTGIGDTTPDYKLDVTGTINAIDGSATGVALRANTLNAVELIQDTPYETPYNVFRWGQGASWNTFPDKVGILTGSPRVALDVDGDVDIGPGDPDADSISDGDELLIADGAPQIEFSDETASATGEEDDYYIHVNNSRFYILYDDEDVDGNDAETTNPEGDWNPPHPLYFHERAAVFSGPVQVGWRHDDYPIDGIIKVISGDDGRTAEFGAEDADPYLHIGSTTNHSFSIITNDTRQVTVQNDGDVGIGQTSPSARLEVSNTDAGKTTLELGRVSSTPTITANSEGSGYLIMDSAGGRAELNRYVDDDVVLAAGGGNVGIYDDTPDAKLDVNGQAIATSFGRMYTRASRLYDLDDPTDDCFDDSNAGTDTNVCRMVAPACDSGDIVIWGSLYEMHSYTNNWKWHAIPFINGLELSWFVFVDPTKNAAETEFTGAPDGPFAIYVKCWSPNG